MEIAYTQIIQSKRKNIIVYSLMQCYALLWYLLVTF